MSSQQPTLKRTTSTKEPKLDKIEELTIAELSIKDGSEESDKKTKAQNSLVSAREKLTEKLKAPRNSASTNLSSAGLPMKAGTVSKTVGTKLSGRDSISVIPAATRLTGRDFASMIPAGTRLADRDDPISFKSMKPQGTLLFNRDYFASMAPGTRLTDRDIKSVLPDQEAVDKFSEITGIPKSFAPSADSLPAKTVVPSALKTSGDAVKAVQQIYFQELTENEKEEQLQWVENILKNTDPCPQGKKWVRHEGGFECEGGGHRFTDLLLSEALGGILALSKTCPQKGRDTPERPNEYTKWEAWENFGGPYYMDANEPGSFNFSMNGKKAKDYSK